MRVIVQLALPEALALQAGGPPTKRLEQVLQIAEDAGVRLRAIHPGATDPFLAPYFIIDVPNRSTADRLIDQLIGVEAVVASYVEAPIPPP